MEDFDYVIVGAGSAGSVMAARLTEDPRVRVLLLEAGGRDTNPWIPIPLGMVRLIGDPKIAWLDMTKKTESFGGRSIPLPQGKMLGGSSSLNGMLYVRGQREDFDDWVSQNGCSGWSWDEVLPYFKKSERLDHGGTPGAHGRDGELSLSWIDNLPKVSRSFLQAAQDAGLPFNEDINDGDQDGIGYLLGTIYKGRRQSTARTFLKGAKGRPNLTIRTDAHVRRVIFEAKRAVGVEVTTDRGASQTLRCNREVVLAAGAIGTPHILQHSGVGDENHLSDLGISSVVHSPEVGQNLQDHLFGHLKYKLNDATLSLNARFNSVPRMGVEVFKWLMFGTGSMTSTTSHICAFIKSHPDLARSDLQIAMRPFSFGMTQAGPGIDSWPGMTVSAIQTRPFSRGEVKITSADPAIRAQVDMNYLSDYRDIEALSSGIRQIREIMQEPEIAQHLVEELEPGPDATSDTALEKHLRETASTVYHPAGTCRMGGDELAVLDPQLRVRGVGGLRVVDCSVMPVITSGNTNAPAIMIGEKGADLIKQSASNEYSGAPI